MAFNAGSLVATFRLGLSGFEADKAKALASFKQAGAAADAAGAAASAVGDKAAAGARKTAAAAQQEAAAHKAAGAAATSAGNQKVSAEKKAETAAERLSDRIHSQRRDFEDVGRGVVAFGAAAAAGFGVAVAAQVQFGAKQAQLRTLAAGDAKSQAQLNAQMEGAAQAALTYGAAYGQSASDVQDAEIELQKAGVGVTEQLNGALRGALTLAAAGQEDVADATSTAVTAMTQFNLSASQVPHLADLLAAGADKALGSVADLSMGLKQGGLVASQFGLSADDTVGTLSAFAQAGLIGSDAGTSFKTMLLSLASPSKQAQEYLKKYNITAYDSQGAFVGITNLAGQLHDRLGNLSQAQRDAALSTIFGTDAIRAANVLYTQGSSGIAGWIDKVNDSGFAAQQAAGKMDSLEGDSQKLASAWQTGLIKAGRDLDPLFRMVVQDATSVVTAFGQLDPVTGAIAIGLTGVVGAAALAGGGLLLLLPKIAEFRVAARTLATADIPLLSASLTKGTAVMGRFRGAGSAAASMFGGPLGLAVAAAGAAVTLYNMAVDKASASTEVLEAAALRGSSGVDALVAASAKGENIATGVSSAIADWSTFGTIEKNVTDDLKGNLQEIEHNNSFGPLGAALNLLEPQTKGTQDALAKMGTTLASVAGQNAPAAASAFQGLIEKYKLTSAEQATLLQSMPAYSTALEAAATQAGVLTGKESDSARTKALLAYAAKEAASAEGSAATNAADLTAKLGGISGSASGATQDVKDLSDALKGFGSTQLDANEAQRQFEQAVADATKEVSKAAGGVNRLRTGFDLTTQAGRDGQQALDGVASSAAASAAAVIANGGSQAEAAAKIRDGRAEYVKLATQMGISKVAAEKLADGLNLIPGQVKVLFAAENAATVQQRIDDIKAAMNQLDGKTAKIYISAVESGLSTGRAAQVAKNAGFAGGGPVRGGRAGVDSVPILAKSGEYVLDTADVSRMGGARGVDAFRADLAGASGFAAGGAIGDAQGRAATASTAVDRLTKTIADEKKRIATLQKKANAAAHAYEKASDATSAIYGKGTGPEKHAAEQHARALSKASKDAAKKLADAQKKLSKDQDARDKQKQAAQDQVSRQTTLQQTSEDLGTSLGRGELVDASNPFGAVDQAISASRDPNYTKAQRSALAKVAATQEKALEGLTKQAADAKAAVDADTDALQTATSATQDAQQSLDQLKDTAKQLASQVASTVAGFFSLGDQLKDTDSTVQSIVHNAGTAAEWDEKQTVVTPGGTTAAVIRSASGAAAASQGHFADQLQALVQKGYSTAVVQDVAALGVDKGGQVADALLAGTSDEVAGINANYASSAAASARAGSTVSNQAYSGDISAAQATLDAKTAAQAAAQAQLDNDNRLVASTNAQIMQAQQAVVAALQTALGKAKANGGIVDAYASGGLRQAQIQPGGRNILWAEGETGGEAYIPFAASKRTRSLAILAETARRLGMAVVPGGQAYANGGVAGSSSTSYGGDTYQLSGMWLGSPREVVGELKRDAAREKSRKNRAAQIGRVLP